MKNNRLTSILLVACMSLILLIPVSAMETPATAGAVSAEISPAYEPLVPLSEPHCQKGSQVGQIVTKVTTEQKGYEIRNCIHGIVGGTDIHYKYLDTIEYSCTLCDYHAVDLNTYWGPWECQR